MAIPGNTIPGIPGALNLTGVNNKIERAREEEEYYAEMDAREQQQQAMAMQRQMDMGYGPPGTVSKSAVPGERELMWLTGVQPTYDDIEKKIEWNTGTFYNTEILRHLQFGTYGSKVERDNLRREYDDLLIIAQQPGGEKEAINGFRRLYFDILSSKGDASEGRDNLMTLMHQPVNRTEFSNKNPTPPVNQRRGFWSFLRG
jgi:hypothetical protein